MTSDELLNDRQLAHRIGVKPRTIRRWARRGLIPSVRIGAKVIRFEWASVRAALAAHEGRES